MTIRRIWTLMTCLCAWAAAAAASAPQQPVVVEGIVLDASTRSAVSSAEVRIEDVTVYTDAGGRFRLSLPDSDRSVRMEIRKSGYYAASRTADAVAPLQLFLSQDESSRNVTAYLHAAASAVGRITRPSGTPIEGAYVAALRGGYNAFGNAGFMRVSLTQTDDRGEFRFFGLEPGDYLFQAERFGLIASNPPLGASAPDFPAFYFPALPGQQSPLPQRLESAQEVFLGTIVPPLEYARLFVQVENHTGYDDVSGGLMGVYSANGSVEIWRHPITQIGSPMDLGSVPWGTYEIRVDLRQGAGPDAPPFIASGRTTIHVSGEEARVVIPAPAGPRVRVRLPAESAWDGVRVRFFGEAGSVTAPVNGATAEFISLSRGSHSISVTGITAPYVVKRVRHADGRIAPPDNFFIDPDVTSVDVELEVGLPRRVQGSVVGDEGAPLAGATVVFIPVGDNGEQRETAVTDQYGRFDLRVRTEGAYVAVAAFGVDPLRMSQMLANPEIVQQYSGHAATIVIDPTTPDRLDAIQDVGAIPLALP